MNPGGDSSRSRVLRVRAATARCCARGRSPGQDLRRHHGVQVATSDASGRLVLLDSTPSRALVLDQERGLQRVRHLRGPADLRASPAASAVLPDARRSRAMPNYAAWGPDGSLYVTDYRQAGASGGSRPAAVTPPAGCGPPPRRRRVRHDRPGPERRPRTLLVAQQQLGRAGGRQPDAPADLHDADRRRRQARRAAAAVGERARPTCPTASRSRASGNALYAAGWRRQPDRRGRAGRHGARALPELARDGDNGSPVPFDTPVERALPRHAADRRQPVLLHRQPRASGAARRRGRRAGPARS